MFTTFPKSTETFLQREVSAMQELGLKLRLYSLWGGRSEFQGLPVTIFNKWRLFQLLGIIPFVAVTRWDVMKELVHGLVTRKPPSWINFWENMLGAGFAGCFYREFKKNPPDLIHAAWGGAPATAAYLLSKMNRHRYTAAAHAYDLYEHGGDWWLREKLRPAIFVHTSTHMGRRTLLELGLGEDRVRCIHRGLDAFPSCKPLRDPRKILRIVCVARLVEKKGMRHQLRIYSALKESGFRFEARIVGTGPLRGEVEQGLHAFDLESSVVMLGHLPLAEVWRQLEWADVLIHTGVVAPSGDRDGLPNVIPEAMAAGVLVVTSPAAATTEAIENEITGLVAEVTAPSQWEAAFKRLRDDSVFAEQLRQNARKWVEENFDAHRNAARLAVYFEEAVKP